MMSTEIFQYRPKGAEKIETKDFNLHPFSVIVRGVIAN